MPVAIRLSLLGCGLAAALCMQACGDGGGGQSGGGGASTEARSPSPSPLAARECQGQVGGFLGSMDALRRRLAVGVAYEQYVHEVEGVRAAYERIPAAELGLGCLSDVGSPAEKGFNVYVDAANAWGECVGEAGCESATVEPVLQRKWRLASRFLSEAHRGLRGLGTS